MTLPSLSGLRAFEAAVRLGSFQRAATELGRVPSAISHSIRQLETELGVTLFERDGRARSLTKAGRLYAKAVRRGFGEIERAHGDIIALQEPTLVRVSTSTAFMTMVLTSRISAYRKRYPDLVLEFDVQTVGCLPFDNEFDAAIVISDGNEPDLVIERLWHSYLVPMALPRFANEVGSLSDPATLAAVPLIHYRRQPHLWGEWFERYAPSIKPPPPEIFYDAGPTALQIVESGAPGVFLGMLPIMAELVRDGRLAVVHPGTLPVTVDHFFAYRPVLANTPKIQNLRRWLRHLARSFEEIPTGTTGSLLNYNGIPTP